MTELEKTIDFLLNESTFLEMLDKNYRFLLNDRILKKLFKNERNGSASNKMKNKKGYTSPSLQRDVGSNCIFSRQFFNLTRNCLVRVANHISSHYILYYLLINNITETCVFIIFYEYFFCFYDFWRNPPPPQ